MKTFAIIEDESEIKRVIPSKWLTEDLKNIYWPPFKDFDKIRKSVINNIDHDPQWELFPINKFFKFYDDYNKAVSEIDIVDKVSDTSDVDKMKRTRQMRSKKGFNEFETNKVTKKTKQQKGTKVLSSSEDSEDSEKRCIDKSGSESDGILLDEPIAPSTLTVTKESGNTSNENTGGDGLVNPQLSHENLFDKPSNLNSHKTKDISSESMNIEENNEIIQELENVNPNNEKETDITAFKILKLLLIKVNTLTRKIDVLDQKISAIQANQYVPINSVFNSTIIHDQMSKYFPINDIDKPLNVVEQKLRVDRRFFDDVIEYLAAVLSNLCLIVFMKNKGGSNSHDLIYNILNSIIVIDLASTYSFAGHKKKKVFF